eukprot:m.363342 g.363342  ORF g.363342 m.363342 type:complete len:71 (-) comp22100_c0_seq1:403-615(-)
MALSTLESQQHCDGMYENAYTAPSVTRSHSVRSLYSLQIHSNTQAFSCYAFVEWSVVCLVACARATTLCL